MDIETLYFSYGGFDIGTEMRLISFEGDMVKMERAPWSGFAEKLVSTIRKSLYLKESLKLFFGRFREHSC